MDCAWVPTDDQNLMSRRGALEPGPPPLPAATRVDARTHSRTGAVDISK
jgi:hypothetical protein